MQAIGVLGPSYCGSTLLNYMLGSHPSIYGGSELRRLFDMDPKRSCAVCGPSCRLWSTENLTAANQAGPDGLYDFLRRLMARPVICDASKSIDHFLRIPPEPFTWVVMTKHPLRSLASFTINRLYRDTSAPDLARARASVTDDEFTTFVREHVKRLSKFYAHLERERAHFESLGDVRYLSYEQVATASEEALSAVLDGSGLTVDPTMLDYANKEHHPIGGNTGPHSQARRKAGRPRTWTGRASYNRGFYESTDGIRLDDKWRDAFTDRQIEQVTGARGFAVLCARLGYEESHDPRLSVAHP